MAKFRVGTETFIVSKALYEAVIPRMSESRLQESLMDLVALERAHEVGKLICEPQDWNEIVELAKKLAFEMSWRPFVQSLGISMEVR